MFMHRMQTISWAFFELYIPGVLQSYGTLSPLIVSSRLFVANYV